MLVNTRRSSQSYNLRGCYQCRRTLQAPCLLCVDQPDRNMCHFKPLRAAEVILGHSALLLVLLETVEACLAKVEGMLVAAPVNVDVWANDGIIAHQLHLY